MRELEIPGFEEKELEIEITDHVLTVKGERAEVKEEKDKTFWLHERLARAFERRFGLPPEADTKEVKAEFKRGSWPSTRQGRSCGAEEGRDRQVGLPQGRREAPGGGPARLCG